MGFAEVSEKNVECQIKKIIIIHIYYSKENIYTLSFYKIPVLGLRISPGEYRKIYVFGINILMDVKCLTIFLQILVILLHHIPLLLLRVAILFVFGFCGCLRMRQFALLFFLLQMMRNQFLRQIFPIYSVICRSD